MLDKILVKEVVKPVLIVLVAFILYFAIKGVVKRFFKIRKKVSKKEKTVYELVMNIIKYFIIIVAFLMILDVYGVDTKTLVTSLGVVGLVAGLALQDTLKDFISGISIIFENQYCVGDIIEINSFRGEVISLGIKTTRIKSYTGEIKIIPNRNVTEVINFSQSGSLAIVDVSVAYEEEYSHVEQVLNKLIEKLNADKNIPYMKGKIYLLGINDLSDSSVQVRIIAEVESYRHLEVERILRKEIKNCFDKEKIKIPYPQIEVHNGERI